MNKTWPIPRRTFLKGLGTVVALPMLEAMMPARLLGAGAAAPGSFPKRMAFVYIPNGANMVDWTPKTVGTDFDLRMETVATRVDRGANDRRERRIDQELPADYDEGALLARVSRGRVLDEIDLATPHQGT